MREIRDFRNLYGYVITFFILSLIFVSQIFAADPPITEYKTQNHIIVVMDGTRYSEIWGMKRRLIYRTSPMIWHRRACYLSILTISE